MANIPAADLIYILNVCRLPSATATLTRSDLELLIAYDLVRGAFLDINSMMSILSKPANAVTDVASEICVAIGWDVKLLGSLLSEHAPAATTTDKAFSAPTT